MLVRRYKCIGNKDKSILGCFNEFWGEEGANACPFCDRTGTLVMYKREWQVEPDCHLLRNREVKVDIIEKP